MNDGEVLPLVLDDRLPSAEGLQSTRLSTEADHSADPRDLLARVRPSFLAAGITRVADVTGLDRIGIPCAVAIRPNSRSLSVSQGKGLTRDLAIVSAVMEALELSAAENLPASVAGATMRAVEGARAPMVDLALSTRCRLDRVGTDEPLLWSEGTDLATGRTLLVPWSLVGIDYRPRPRGFANGFQVSTDGLASGSNLEDAILHGLCELVERDATALLEFAAAEELARRVYAIDDSDAPEVVRMKDMIVRAGCRLTILDMTTDLGIPAFNAIISDTGESSAATLYAHSGGSGCHPVPAVALRKAIVEAAQSRITRITGSRDDLPAATYQAAEGSDRAQILGLLSFADGARAGRPKPEALSTSMAAEENLELMIQRLGEHGISQLVAVPIENDFGISVVRVLVPGLQTEITGSSSKLGRRALIKLARRLQ